MPRAKNRLVVSLAIALSGVILLVSSFQKREPGPQASPSLTLNSSAVPELNSNQESEELSKSDNVNIEEFGTDNTGQGFGSSTCQQDMGALWSSLFEVDRDRTANISFVGEYLESYRDLNIGDLETLALQNDANAMSVLGVAIAFSELGISVEDVVPTILAKRDQLRWAMAKESGKSISREKLEESVGWLRNAALHGRLEALSKIGSIYQYSDISPVDLGWISERDYQALDGAMRNRFLPARVFRVAYYAVEPNALRFPSVESNDDWARRTKAEYGKYWDSVIEPIVSDFRSELKARNLSIPKVPRRNLNDPDFQRWRECRSKSVR